MILENIANHIICLYSICRKLPPVVKNGPKIIDDDINSMAYNGGLTRKFPIPSIYADTYMLFFLKENHFEILFIEKRNNILLFQNQSTSETREICEFNLRYSPEEKKHRLYFVGGNITGGDRVGFDSYDQIDRSLIIEFFEHLEFKQKILEDLESFLCNWCVEFV